MLQWRLRFSLTGPGLAMVAYFFLDCPACHKSHLLCLREEDGALPAFPAGNYRYACPDKHQEVMATGIKLETGYLEDVDCPEDSVVISRVA